MAQSDYDGSTRSTDVEAPEGDVKAWQVLADTVANLLQLARAEAVAAVTRLPDMLLLWVLHIPALILMWVSFSILPAWTAYSLTGWVFAGLLVFFILQVVLVVTVNKSMKRQLHAASFPLSRQYASRLVNTLLAEPGLPAAANDEAAGR